MLFTFPILCSCLNSVHSWDPGCLSVASHGPPRLSVGIGPFPRLFYLQSADFRVHDDGFTAFSRYGPLEPPLYCGRMRAGEQDRLKEVWEDPELVAAAQQEPCSEGYAFWTGGPPTACRETVVRFRGSVFPPYDYTDFPPQFRLTWNDLRGSSGWQLNWDFEATLPPAVEDAVAETVKIVCAESKMFRRRFHRHLPEIAETFGC